MEIGARKEMSYQFSDEVQQGKTLEAKHQEQDVKILQKVNAAHRNAFQERYPGQVEHCLRLTMERLQACLDKRGAVDVNNPDTWLLPPVEIADLAKAAYYLHEIRKDLK